MNFVEVYYNENTRSFGGTFKIFTALSCLFYIRKSLFKHYWPRPNQTKIQRHCLNIVVFASAEFKSKLIILRNIQDIVYRKSIK